MFFTLQSNVWMIVMMTALLIDEIRTLKGKPSFINVIWRKIRFVILVSVMLTFVVFGLLLAPVIPLSYTLSVTSLTLHFIAPLVALADYLLFEPCLKWRTLERLAIGIPPLYYFGFVMACVGLGIRFPPDDTLVPYFFMNFELFGWFRISSTGIGVAYWMIILMGIVTLIAFALDGWQRRIHKKRLTT